ncbi:MAG: hypothetical protein MUO63_03675 [Desulfobulbaceae bacterium]|nr:hypothetical protein [Desulfobulbaceae bacterium]
MDFLINSAKVLMYERASAIEFFFSVRIVVNSDMEVPSTVSTLMAMTSFPVRDLVMRRRKPGMLYNLSKQDLIINPLAAVAQDVGHRGWGSGYIEKTGVRAQITSAIKLPNPSAQIVQ